MDCGESCSYECGGCEGSCLDCTSGSPYALRSFSLRDNAIDSTSNEEIVIINNIEYVKIGEGLYKYDDSQELVWVGNYEDFKGE